MKIPYFKIWILGCVTEGTRYKKKQFRPYGPKKTSNGPEEASNGPEEVSYGHKQASNEPEEVSYGSKRPLMELKRFHMDLTCLLWTKRVLKWT